MKGVEHTMFFRSLLPSAWSARVRLPSPRGPRGLRGAERRTREMLGAEGVSGELRGFRADGEDCEKKTGVRGGLKRAQRD